MTTSVSGAFAQFLQNSVRLDSEESRNARSSRDWLRGQLHNLDKKHEDTPISFSVKDIDFGSFARRTKIRELDDLDLIHCMNAEAGTYTETIYGLNILVKPNSRLANYCHDGSDRLNSRKIVNLFVRRLSLIPQYSRSELHRNGEAITLNLTSYPWKFDIVPGFVTVPENDGRSYYLVPDGSGQWKKTDPRMDRDWVTAVNNKHSGRVLDVVRIVKYWNRRPTMPSVPSYALECMVVAFYDRLVETASQYIDIELIRLLDHLGTAVLSPISDPKEIQGNLNTMSLADCFKISSRARKDLGLAQEARRLESVGKIDASIRKWAEVLGGEFPV